RHSLAVDDARIPSAMVEMQMRVHDDIDLLRLESARGKLRRQSRRAFKCINVAALVVPFIARSGFHQDPLRCRANQQRIHRQRDAIALVGSHDAFPHGLRDDAKHGAAVETERAIIEDMKFDGAEFHCDFETVFVAPPFGAASVRCACAGLKPGATYNRPTLSHRRYSPARAISSRTAVYGFFLRSATSEAKDSRARWPSPPSVRARSCVSSSTSSCYFHYSRILPRCSPLCWRCSRTALIASAS